MHKTSTARIRLMMMKKKMMSTKKNMMNMTVLVRVWRTKESLRPS